MSLASLKLGGMTRHIALEDSNLFKGNNVSKSNATLKEYGCAQVL